MQVGDLVTHKPTGSVGIIVDESEHSVCVVWCTDPMNGMEGEEEWITKVFIENLKGHRHGFE